MVHGEEVGFGNRYDVSGRRSSLFRRILGLRMYIAATRQSQQEANRENHNPYPYYLALHT